jgi:hypothetical protein
VVFTTLPKHLDAQLVAAIFTQNQFDPTVPLVVENWGEKMRGLLRAC